MNANGAKLLSSVQAEFCTLQYCVVTAALSPQVPLLSEKRICYQRHALGRAKDFTFADCTRR
jgi:hypothetical protein